MGRAHIITRVKDPATGRWRSARDSDPRGLERRYLIRYRLAGRSSRLRHGGSRRTLREAEARKRYIDDELAAGRVPDLNPGAEDAASPPVQAVLDGYIDGKHDVEAGTRESLRTAYRRLGPVILQMPTAELDARRVQAWIDGAVRDGRWGAMAINVTVGVLHHALLRHGVRPSPADPDVVTKPVYQRPEVNPPRVDECLHLLEALPARWRPVVMFLEGTGLRVGEAAGLLGRDIDRAGGQILVRRGVTKHRRRSQTPAGRRWIPVRPATLALLPPAAPDAAALPFNVKSLQSAIRDARKRAGLREDVTPHKLRHRWGSRQIAQGVDVETVRRVIGHENASMTLDVYTHVMLDDGLDPALDLAELVVWLG